MRGFDAFAGVIKSGGKTRRAAKMVILNADHPDIVDFIECKAKEEAKACSLIKAGYDGSGPDSEAYSSIFFQNANNSVRVTDEFMHAVETDGDFTTHTVKGRAARQGPTRRATSCTRSPRPPGSAATRACSSTPPSTVAHQQEHRPHQRVQSLLGVHVPRQLRLQPCQLQPAEVRHAGRPFDIPAYRHAIAVVITAMEILVDASGYPTESISKNSHDYRPLGLGYANLGALLMAFGLPYDSDAGRDFAATLTAIICGEAYCSRPRIAESARRSLRPHRSPSSANARAEPAPASTSTASPSSTSSACTAPKSTTSASRRTRAEPFIVPQLDAAHRRRRDMHGTMRSGSRREATAIATRRSPSWRPPAPSAS